MISLICSMFPQRLGLVLWHWPSVFTKNSMLTWQCWLRPHHLSFWLASTVLVCYRHDWIDWSYSFWLFRLVFLLSLWLFLMATDHLIRVYRWILMSTIVILSYYLNSNYIKFVSSNDNDAPEKSLFFNERFLTSLRYNFSQVSFYLKQVQKLKFFSLEADSTCNCFCLHFSTMQVSQFFDRHFFVPCAVHCIAHTCCAQPDSFLPSSNSFHDIVDIS